MDKTTLVNMVNASHSVHLLKINMRECDILTNAYRWQASVTGKVRGLRAHMGLGHGCWWGCCCRRRSLSSAGALGAAARGAGQPVGALLWLPSLQAFQDEIDRNRNRVKEIFQYIDNLQEQLDNSLQEQLDSIVLVEPPE